MGYREHCALLELGGDRVLDYFVGGHVHICSCLIEYQNLSPVEECPCKTQQLLLPCGENRISVTAEGKYSLFKASHVLCELNMLKGLPECFLRETSEGIEVVSNGALEEKGGLRNDSETSS